MPQDLGFSFDISASGEELLNGSGQLERITWLTKRIRQGDFFLLQDGSYSRLLLSELLECFVGGHFIATSILGFSLIERSIAGRLAFNGDAKKSEAKSVELLKNEAGLRKVSFMSLISFGKCAIRSFTSMHKSRPQGLRSKLPKWAVVRHNFLNWKLGKY